MDRKTSWYLHGKKADFKELSSKYNISEILARIIINRGIHEEEIESFLTCSFSDIEVSSNMKDLVLARDFLIEALKEEKSIRIVGDYDIDGVCATYILYKSLSKLSKKVSYEIPDRIKDGYGINENIIEEAKKDGIDLILTCDNGISAFLAIELANKYEIDVIVTDHHELRKDDDKDILPNAKYIIDPKRSDCEYNFKSICGANVAYKLVRSLYETLNLDLEIFEELLEFVCIATVGDVMPLIKENRVLVREGLSRIRKTKNIGLDLLIKESNLDKSNIDTYHLGFIIGPCINAGGRLESAKLSLELFLDEDLNTARDKAIKLLELNNKRKDLTLKGVDLAEEKIEKFYKEDKILLVHLEDTHESLAGIIAGRIKEKYYRPCFIFTDSSEGIKGSARSIPTYDVFYEIERANKYLLKYGGHKMAAGLSLSKEKLDDLRIFLNKNCELTEKDLVEKMWIDVALPFSHINESLIEELKRLEPFGLANEKPNFAIKGIKVKYIKLIGKNKNVLKCILESVNKIRFEGILFNEVEKFFELVNDNDFIDIVYYPSINEYNGIRTINIVIKHWQLSNN